jgi:hypothetical protein
MLLDYGDPFQLIRSLPIRSRGGRVEEEATSKAGEHHRV